MQRRARDRHAGGPVCSCPRALSTCSVPWRTVPCCPPCQSCAALPQAALCDPSWFANLPACNFAARLDPFAAEACVPRNSQRCFPMLCWLATRAHRGRARHPAQPAAVACRLAAGAARKDAGVASGVAHARMHTSRNATADGHSAMTSWLPPLPSVPRAGATQQHRAAGMARDQSRRLPPCPPAAAWCA